MSSNSAYTSPLLLFETITFFDLCSMGHFPLKIQRFFFPLHLQEEQETKGVALRCGCKLARLKCRWRNLLPYSSLMVQAVQIISQKCWKFLPILNLQGQSLLIWNLKRNTSIITCFFLVLRYYYLINGVTILQFL